MNTEKILEGLRAAKQAFEQTLEYCKKDDVRYGDIYDFANNNDTENGICLYLSLHDFYEAYNFTCNFFNNDYYVNPIKSYIRRKMCIQVTTKRVKWLESKIKELEANK